MTGGSGGPERESPGAGAERDDSPETGAEVDGRLARGRRTRRNVAQSLVGLLENGVAEPTARQVAEGAGVSLRLVFHHFDHMEDLYREVCQLQFERHWEGLPAVPRELPLAERIDRLVADRADRFEQVAVIRRAGLRRSDQSPVIAAIIERSNALLRRQLVEALAPELAADDDQTAARGGAGAGAVGRRRPDLLEALDAAASWSAWEQLRRNQRLPAVAARQVMALTVAALLASCRRGGDAEPSGRDARRPAAQVPAAG